MLEKNEINMRSQDRADTVVIKVFDIVGEKPCV